MAKPALMGSGQLVLQRLSAEELSRWLAHAQESEECKDMNEWLEAAAAQKHRMMAFRLPQNQQIEIGGTLWQLWNGQFFWTSFDGRVWNPEPLGH